MHWKPIKMFDMYPFYARLAKGTLKKPCAYYYLVDMYKDIHVGTAYLI